MTSEQNPRNIHGSAIVLGNRGLLISGPSGSGKTTLCQKLLDKWQTLSHFATWVGDDQVLCSSSKTKHVIRAAPEIAGLAEQRFSGINQINYQESAVLDLEVCLIPASQLERLPQTKTSNQLKELPSIDAPQRNAELAIELIIARLKSF